MCMKVARGLWVAVVMLLGFQVVPVCAAAPPEVRFNSPAVTQATQPPLAAIDCPYCEYLRPLKRCCGFCGRVNDCELCLTGVHELPGGRNILVRDDEELLPFEKEAVNKCPACRHLKPPRNCCGKCGRPYECPHCATGVHAPGGGPITPAISNAVVRARMRMALQVNDCPACRHLKPPRNCCGVCGRPYECPHCAVGEHLPGGRPFPTRAGVPVAGFAPAMVSTGAPSGFFITPAMRAAIPEWSSPTLWNSTPPALGGRLMLNGTNRIPASLTPNGGLPAKQHHDSNRTEP